MKRRLMLIGACVCLSGCASTTEPENLTGKLLCIRSLVDGQVHTDCLNALSASETEVKRRVELYNEGKDENDKIRCANTKRLGTSIARWRCANIHTSTHSLRSSAYLIDLINTAP